ncbi:hypothetical protein BAUCODRAFT_95572 [Baudoinia panamericana UAMH 10762]|uniref:Vacuolar calcium ion transporter n=1 Tax=Baudoinia panamericana (strain UAMH 10762) TaxID=717646 RepID=M2MQB8_BAUPA|nr:uncharacterized protein BAUCODRAFT_95572 [Baudoinia panamericana UAMH 10762]EMC93673.1 hypothetical protein BAUCODRAFT_95572 [Baudoinia panamericana UAMH 10762]
MASERYRGGRVFARKSGASKPTPAGEIQPQIEAQQSPEDGAVREKQQPQYNEKGQRINHNGHVVTKWIHPDGESGRSWFHPWHFFRVCFRSSCTASKLTNFLWPFTLAALVLHFNYEHEHHLWVFITAFIGMVPAANLVGFGGQELARKMPKVAGIILETTFGSIVEIILFIVLIKGGVQNVPVIRAAILGSILANLLFCLGLCFFIGGIFWPQQTFHEAISEVGSNLMLVAAVGLVIPTIFYNSLSGRLPPEQNDSETLRISRAAAIILLVAFLVYIWFQARSHHGLYEDILEADEERDHDRHKDLQKPKLTFTEACIAVVIALTFVSFMAVFLVQEIEFMVHERHISDAFMGLILVPIVEKASEHLTAIDEAYDNQMNFALSHVLGASIQTALLNTPLVVLVGWGLGVDMSLNFELFDAVVLILAIIVVGNFLRDEKSDYLEGALCVFVYILIAVSAWYYPDPPSATETSSAANNVTEITTEAVHRLLRI